MTTGHRLAERFAETLTAHDLDAFSTLLHPDYVNHNRYAEPGKAGSVAVFGAFLAAFDDFRVEVDDIIDAEGDRRWPLHVSWTAHRNVPRRTGQRR